jgi:hypothetical protein
MFMPSSWALAETPNPKNIPIAKTAKPFVLIDFIIYKSPEMLNFLPN